MAIIHTFIFFRTALVVVCTFKYVYLFYELVHHEFLTTCDGPESSHVNDHPWPTSYSQFPSLTPMMWNSPLPSSSTISQITSKVHLHFYTFVVNEALVHVATSSIPCSQGIIIENCPRLQMTCNLSWSIALYFTHKFSDGCIWHYVGLERVGLVVLTIARWSSLHQFALFEALFAVHQRRCNPVEFHKMLQPWSCSR